MAAANPRTPARRRARDLPRPPGRGEGYAGGAAGGAPRGAEDRDGRDAPDRDRRRTRRSGGRSTPSWRRGTWCRTTSWWRSCASASASRTATGASSSTASRAPCPRREGLEEMSGDPRAWVVFDFEVPRDELMLRLSGRRWCPSCQATFHLRNDPPKRPGVCDACGTALVQREDDHESVVAQRLRQYDERTFPLIEYYRTRARMVPDRRQPPDGRGVRGAARGGGGAGVSVQKSWSELQTMARACRIVVETLDALEAAAVPGVTHEGDGPHRPRAHREGRGAAGVPRLPRLPGDAVHLGERGGRARHPRAAQAPRGRHRRPRPRLHRGRLLRRRGAHGRRWGRSSEEARSGS